MLDYDNVKNIINYSEKYLKGLLDENIDTQINQEWIQGYKTGIIAFKRKFEKELLDFLDKNIIELSKIEKENKNE